MFGTDFVKKKCDSFRERIVKKVEEIYRSKYKKILFKECVIELRIEF